MDETTLIRKLVFTGHLNVSERKALPGRVAKASLIISAIEEALESGHFFHAWWLPDDSMVGCTIEYRGDGPGRVCVGSTVELKGTVPGSKNTTRCVRRARPSLGTIGVTSVAQSMACRSIAMRNPGHCYGTITSHESFAYACRNSANDADCTPQ